MTRRMMAWAALAAVGLMTMDCALTNVRLSGAGPGLNGVLEARAFPEVEIVTFEGDPIIGKILRLESGWRVTVLPMPYWNVATEVRPLAAIALVRRLKTPSQAGPGALAGLGLFGTLTGLIGIPACKYDIEYRNVALAISLAAVAGAGLGALLGLAASKKVVFDLARMSPEQKAAALAGLMGR
ncbi:MAG: hypothetical protein NTZ26_12295 [Candidatus Aminicenantes bacterium]|nr:hypothetical protein [Candidatus Aminicenantes bacterium]